MLRMLRLLWVLFVNEAAVAMHSKVVNSLVVMDLKPSAFSIKELRYSMRYRH
jgi:hypothetical protein